MPDNRRRYRRLLAPVYCRPAGLRARLATQDISVGGVRIYSDTRYKVGDRLELEVALPDQTWISVEAQVVWISKLEATGPAKFDVGLEFSRIATGDVDKLAQLIED